MVRCIERDNDKAEQIAANNLTTPQDAIASLLQRLVSPFLSIVALELPCCEREEAKFRKTVQESAPQHRR